MAGKPIPNPSIVQTLRLRVVRVVEKRRIWTDPAGARYYAWDGLHGEFEVYTRRGFHLGAVDPVTGLFIKDAVKGRRIRV
jgi:hypothetical protein